MQKLKYDLVEDKLINLGLKIFTANDLCQIFGAGKRASEAFLSYNAKRKVLVRLKKGFYSLRRNLPHDFLIANKIYSPSYVSLETALSFYSIIPETVYAITSISSKKTASFLANGREFIYHKIKLPSFIGYTSKQVGNDIVYLALQEKAVADFCYFVFLKKKGWNDRLTLRGLDEKKVMDYLKILNGGKLVRFWKELPKKND